MKKILILLLTTAIASFVQAGSILWKTEAIYFDAVAMKNNTNVGGYLIYLESGTHEASYTVDATFDTSKIGVAVAHDTDGTAKGSQIGSNGSNFVFKFENQNPYFNGDIFTVLVYYNDGVDTWWNLSADTRTISGLTELANSTADNWTSFAINGEKGTDGTLVAGGGWTKVPAVPEPATASLALLGVALLIKRRRA